MSNSRAFVLVFIANLAQMTSFYLFLHFPGQVLASGGGEQIVGWLVAVTEIAAIAVSPLAGRWLDSGRRGRVLLAAAVANVLLCLGFLLAQTLWPLLALRVLHGAVETVANAAFFARAAELIPASARARGFALFGVSSMGAVGLGALVGDAALAVGGYAGLYTACIALSTIAAALLLLGPQGEAVSPDEDVTPRGWVATLTAPALRTVWLQCAAFFFAMVALFVFLKTRIEVTQQGSMGLFFALYAGTAVCLRLAAGGLPERVGLQRAATAALGAYAAALLVLSVSEGLTGFCVAAVLAGVGHGYGYPVLLALATKRAGSADEGSAIAIYNAVDDGAALIAAPVLGTLIAAAGYGTMFATTGAVLGLAALAAQRLSRTDRDGA